MRVEGGPMASRAGMGMAGLGMGLAGGHRTPRISMDILEKGSTQKKNHKASKVTRHQFEQPPLFGKERNSLWMETFFFFNSTVPMGTR